MDMSNQASYPFLQVCERIKRRDAAFFGQGEPFLLTVFGHNRITKKRLRIDII